MNDPHYADATITLHHGDCLDVLRSDVLGYDYRLGYAPPLIPDNTIDAVVTDPPYGLEFMSKGWDAPWQESDVNADAGFNGGGIDATRSLPSFTGSTNPKCNTCKGTRRGRRDGTAKVAVCLCPDGGRFPNVRAVEMRTFGAWCEQWTTECLRVLKPGGHLLAFGGTRTWHRLAVAVEDAGFEVRDSIAWLYGSGFPKSLDVSKAIDKRPGVTRHAEFAQHLAERRDAAGMSRADVSERVVGTRTGACWNWEHHQFPEAKWWPALRDLLGLDESIWGPVIAEAERQKIGQRTTGLGTGRGAVAYIGDSENRDVTAPATDDAREWEGWGTALKPAFEPVVVARKPLAGTVAANVLAHGTGALNIDGCRIGDEQRTNNAGGVSSLQRVSRVEHGYRETITESTGRASAVSGRWPANVVLDECQAAELDQQSGVQRDGVAVNRRKDPAATKPASVYGEFRNGDLADQTYGGMGGASRFFYVAKADQGERVRINGTAHPTVKPIALMRWLVRLVTPPGGTVLEPFAGSGTTVEACILEGFRCIAIERETEYLPLIVQRIHRRRDPVAAVKGAGEDGGLFDLLDGGAA